MRCINKVAFRHKEKGKLTGYWYVPCGQCYACRVNRTQQWTFRLILELTDWESACFITLTYNDDNLPAGNGLYYRDLQLFFKRLRKNYGKKIKYYAVGEYGDNDEQINYGNKDEKGRWLGRPHYHAIVYGLPNNNDTRLIMVRCWKLCSPDRFLYNGKGVANVTIDSIAYVSGYCQKKLLGNYAKKVYEDQGIASPQSRCSRGLGLAAFGRNIDQVKANGCVFWNGAKLPVPRYFREKFELPYYPAPDEIDDMAKFAFGDDFVQDKHFEYFSLYQYGLLQMLVADKLKSTNEQRRLDHLAAQRAKSSLRASRSYTNRSFD